MEMDGVARCLGRDHYIGRPKGFVVRTNGLATIAVPWLQELWSPWIQELALLLSVMSPGSRSLNEAGNRTRVRVPGDGASSFE